MIAPRRAFTWIALAGIATLVLLGLRARRDSAARAMGLEQERLDRATASTAAPSAADSAFADSVLRAAEDMGAQVTTRESTLPAPEQDPARTASLLLAYAGDTYLGEILDARDSTNFRWPDRRADPMRVWIQSSTPLELDRAFPGFVRGAFAAWEATGIPVAFAFVDDSAAAEVQVTWADRYESRTSGRTRWVNDQHGWIVGAGIELAVHQPDGRRLDPASMRAIARHEVGHLLGLDHCADERNIMSERVRVPELSEADRRTVRLVYRLPPGSLRAR
jgi:hypothetical protein